MFVVTGNADAELTLGADGVRKQIAFYGSTPAYRKVLRGSTVGAMWQRSCIAFHCRGNGTPWAR